LAQLDVNGLLRFYADLHRESLSTGDLPVSVRHLEAMNFSNLIFGSVRSDDIDLAIQVTVDIGQTCRPYPEIRDA